MLPIFPHSHTSEIRTFPCKISPLQEAKKVEDLTYFLECKVFQEKLNGLVSHQGESLKIMELIVKEIFAIYLFD
jgi:hypothetical protein